MPKHAVTVRRHWGEETPDWVAELASECDARGSQEAVGKAIGYSASVVNQVLQNKYKGALDKVAHAVRGALMGATVACPVAGTLRRDLCLKEQDMPLHSGDPGRADFWRACRSGCPHSRLKQEFFPERKAES